MEINFITKEDLAEFKKEILKEIRDVINGADGLNHQREWLKSSDIRKMLKISPGTLQNLRITGMLPYKKIGGSMYYRRVDINKMLEGEKKGK